MAAKIKDGLFIGDADTSQDPEFLELNKISNLVNFAGREIPNVWAAHGLVYNTYNWEDRDDFKLFDTKNEILSEIVVFIDKAIRHGASVLLFSTKGIGRCTAAVCAYLMYKYGWGFEKSYDFVYSKKPDIELNRGFVEQLFSLDKKLRHKRYQGREGNDLTSQEHKRISEWDPTYLVQSAAAEEQGAFDGKNSTLRKSLTASHIIPDTTSMDELLMVHSYINSKMTITSLPGPYQDALRQPKVFTLQINLANNQEAGVHLRRTVPPHPSSLPPRGGILKGGPNNYRVVSQQAAQSTSSHSKKKVTQQKQTMRDLEEDSSSLSDEENGNRRKQPHRHHHSQRATPSSQQQSIETLSLHAPSQSSQASDLYDFVGVSQQQQQQQQQAAGESKRGSSAEDRLHNLLGDLQRGDRNKSKSQSSGTAEPKNTVRSSLDRDMKHLSSKQTSMSTLTPSSSAISIPSTIHDIASMTIQPSYQPPSATPTTTTRTRTLGNQAISTSSSSQPVKSSANVSIQKDNGESKEKYQAWMERDQEEGTTASSSYYNHSGKAKTRGPGGAPTRPTSAPPGSTPSSARKSSNGTPSQAYRHGSPAPQISRNGLASKSQNGGLATQKDRDDGSVDDRDNRSTLSSGSAGSRTRGSTPTRQATNTTDTPNRSTTPLRQRAPSPTVRDREKGATISIGVSPREREETNRRMSGGGRENGAAGGAGTTARSTTPLRERPESRERGTNLSSTTNGTTGGGGAIGGTGGGAGTGRSGTPSRGIRTDGSSSGRSASPWSGTERESSHRGWKY